MLTGAEGVSGHAAATSHMPQTFKGGWELTERWVGGGGQVAERWLGGGLEVAGRWLGGGWEVAGRPQSADFVLAGEFVSHSQDEHGPMRQALLYLRPMPAPLQASSFPLYPD